MNTSILLALYGSGILGVLAYFLILPRLSHQPAGSSIFDENGRLNFYTHGTGELSKCYPYSFRVMVSDDKVKLPKHQVNVICKPQVPAELLSINHRGVVLSGSPKKIPA